MSDDFDSKVPLVAREYSNVMFAGQPQLWEDLMALVNSNEAFFYSDQAFGDSWYRIFNYRLASYTDFMQPGAMECRGVTFEISEEGPNAEPYRLACRPPEKFFNLGENPMVMDLDLSNMDVVMEKADGSLISSYMHIDKWGFATLQLKSKGSLHSEQAVAAMEWLNLPENSKLKYQIGYETMTGYTINMEWCAPENRIVLAYDKPQLRIHSSRCGASGDYRPRMHYVSNKKISDVLHEHWVTEYTYKDFADTPEEFVAKTYDMTDDIEGFVVEIRTNWHDVMRVKLKTLHYLTLHRAKDSINSDRRLYEAVLADATDDLRTLFVDDQQALDKITWMEDKVQVLYNHLVDSVERFYERNKELDRKEYAILGQQELEGKQFGLAMSKYLGKEVNYRDFMLKKWKEYGIKDEKVEKVEKVESETVEV